MYTFARLAPVVLLAGLSTSYAEYQEGNDGDVTFEAEHYHLSTPQTQHAWLCSAVSGLSGYAGDGAMWAAPEDTKEFWSPFNDPTAPALDTVSPRLDYRVDIDTAGEYLVWVRAFAPGGSSNSWHIGLDGAEVSSGAYMIDPTLTFDSYVWVNSREIANNTFAPATLTLSAGSHTINLWMRESGVYIDRIHLVHRATFPAWDPEDPGFVDPNTPGFTDPTSDTNVVVVGADVLPSSVTAAVPIFEPDGGPLDPADPDPSRPQQVTLSVCSSGNGATTPDIYYTLGPEGTVADPTAASTQFTAPFDIPADNTEVRAIASVSPAMTLADSAVVSRVFDTDQWPVFLGPAIADMPGLVQGVAMTPVDVSALFSDPDGDTLSYKINGRDPAVSGITISALGVIEGTPTQADVDASPMTLTVVATDPESAFATSNSFTVTVAEGNDPPTITGTPATSVAKNTAYSFTPAAADADGDTPLTFSILNQPTWALFDTSTGALTGTPGDADVGTTSGIVISVDDGQGLPNSVTSLPAFDIEVTNAAPSITSTAVTTAAQGFTYTYNITSTDPDAGVNTLVVSASTLPAWLTLTDGGTGDGSATLTGTPGNPEVGNHPVVLVVTDENGATGTQSFTIAVDNVNDAPTISGTPGTTVAEGAAYSFTPTASDVDGDTLVFSITSKPSWASFDTATGALTGTPGNSDVGTTAGVVISVSDGNGGSASLPAFDLTVTNVNDAPSLTSTPVTAATQDAAYTYSISSSDPDVGDALVVSAPTLPAWLTLADSGTGSGAATLSGTPTAAEIGSHPVVLEVSDGNGGTDSQSFTIVVSAPADTSSGGGGGCAVNPAAGKDPTLPLLVLAAAGYLLRRRKSS